MPIVMIDNFQWIDDASLQLLNDLTRDVVPLLLVIATRPLNDPPAL